LSLSGILARFSGNQARTDAEHPDSSLRGRTYAISFSKVWTAARDLASAELRGWALQVADEDAGILKAECRVFLVRDRDEVVVRISLDENGQTRVDMTSSSPAGKRDLGRNARRIRRFFSGLDKKIGAGHGTILDPTIPLIRTVLLVLGFCMGCGGPEAAPSAAAREEVDSLDPDRNFQGRSYERDLVFLTYRGDSTLLVPIFFGAHTRPDGVVREIRGWLARGEVWDPFFAEEWEGPPSPVPWRVLPRGPLRLVVGMEDALETVIFQEGGRSLEMSLGELLVEWSGQRAQTFRVHEGSLLLSDHTVEGYILDMTRAWTSEDPPPGDWGILISGDSLQVVMEDEASVSGPEGGAFSVRARIEFLDRQWEGVRLTWSETRAFEEARRDVPVRWRVRAPDGDLGGSLSSRAPFLDVTEGEGPMLPVDALFEVAGNLILAGREYPVRGLIRHQQR
jgi:hypothetical protein